ncbi:MAG TPA: anion transporter [Fimbriimonadaceae bacterium]|nr:anion transporter [Fimbriimonadaceae bacterium]
MGGQGWALGVFVLVYAIILAGENSPRKLDRPAAGLIGAVLMVLTGVLTRKEAVAAIDFGTLALLFGMMVVIHYASASGLLERLAVRLVALSHNPRQLLFAVCASAGVLSALFVNDTVCLLMTPMVLAIVAKKRLPAEPYLIGLATSSNVGSVMTLTGNPQNMLIGQSSGWTWSAFAVRMAPIGILCLLANGLIVDWIYRKQLRGAPWQQADGIAPSGRLDRRVAIKTLCVLSGLVVALLLGAPMDMAALAAAVVILVWANRESAETFAAIDWPLLLFFAGLFVVVHGVTKSESFLIGRYVPVVTRNGGSLGELTGFSLASLLGSNLFSNVPFVMLIRPWMSDAPHAPLLWLALASSSTFAGNLTILGSVANLIVAQQARREHPLSFWAFLRVGIITTLVTTAISVLVLFAYHSLSIV